MHYDKHVKVVRCCPTPIAVAIPQAVPTRKARETELHLKSNRAQAVTPCNMKAHLSGKSLEALVAKQLNSMRIPVRPTKRATDDVPYALRSRRAWYAIPQFPYRDVFHANARCDFLVTNDDRRFFIECKNQNVRGSVDQKFLYYIHNIMKGAYGPNGRLVFVVNPNGIRPNVYTWLTSHQQEYGYHVVHHKQLDKLHDILRSQVQK